MNAVEKFIFLTKKLQIFVQLFTRLEVSVLYRFVQIRGMASVPSDEGEKRMFRRADFL